MGDVTEPETDVRFCSIKELAAALRRRSASIMQDGDIAEGFLWNAIAQRVQETDDALARIANANETDHVQEIVAAARGPKPNPDDGERKQ